MKILKRHVIWILVSVVPMTQHCAKYEKEMYVTTGSETSIGYNSAEINGSIVDLGEGAQQYGHCYAKTPGVTTSDMKTQLGKPKDQISFISKLTNLEPETKYYVKAYLSDGNKTVYGKEISFTTLYAPQILLYVSSVIEDDTPSLLEMTYNKTLSNIVPATSAFSVMVNSAPRSVDSVKITEAKVLLVLESEVVSGDAVTVAYTKPSTNTLQTPSGDQAESIEAQNVTNNVLASIPEYVSSVIEDATPSLLEMTYNKTLSNIVPATSAFSVMVNSLQRTINSVSITEAQVQLSLESEVADGDVVTVDYIKPATNPLQTQSGGQAESIEAQSVTNNVSSSTLEYISSVIEDAAPSLLEMTFNTTFADIVPDTSAFTVNVNYVRRGVSSAAISGKKVQLTLGSDVVFGDVVTVAYSKPALNPLQALSGIQLESFADQIVTNNCLTVPIVSTDLIFNVTLSTAQSGGEIIFDGGASILEKGVCWSSVPNPTIEDDISTDGSGPSIFTSTLSGLSANTTYYVKGYATNSKGTGYGNERVFKTYTGIIYDIELNSYFTVTIGSQIWMAENLRVTRLSDGTHVSTEEDSKLWYSLTTPAYCWYDNNEEAFKDTYGALYNYYTIETDKICPAGWHVPIRAEWEELKSFLGGTSVAGGKMKESGNDHWTFPNEGATNESGFTALPAGRRVAASGSTTVFHQVGFWTWWWEYGTRGDCYRVNYNSSSLDISTFGYKFEGHSIRCIKD